MENTFSTLSVRHSWRRKFVLLSVREFTLTIIWASPAVKHGASPPEALVALLCSAAFAVAELCDRVAVSSRISVIGFVDF